MSDVPDEPRGGLPGPGDDESPDESESPDDPDAPYRGWIDPEDRLWRHPSEVAAGARTPLVLNAPPHHPYRSAGMVLVGVGAAMAAVAWVAVLLSPASQPSGLRSTRPPANASLTTLTGTQGVFPGSDVAARRSIVELVATTAHGDVPLIGTAVAAGGLVVTAANAAGVRQLVAVTADGTRLPAEVLATDGGSDVALVEVPEELPVAPFADDSTLASGSADTTLSMDPSSGRALVLHSTPGSVRTVGTPVVGGPAGGMPSITSSVMPSGAVAGAPLLDRNGAIVGFLYRPGRASSAPPAFLPASLVVGVAHDLREQDRVVHGWLGISGSDSPAGGAKVGGVEPHSAAAGVHLAAGQVIVGVNDHPVRSMAELRGRLYVLPPGEEVALSVEQPTGTRTVVDVVLAGSS